MGTKDLKRIAIERIKKAGYEYAKYKYENWLEEYCQYDDDEESYYKDSIDSDGHPFENFFVDQISEESYHNYCDGDNDDFYNNFGIELSDEEKACFEEADYIYDYFDEGMSVFIKSTYK